MKFTLSWLKEHLETDADLATIVDTLTRVGLEVEGVASCGGIWVEDGELARMRQFMQDAERTDTPQDHKRCRFVSPAFTDIWAACFLADSMQCLIPHQRLQILVIFALRGTYSEPLWAALWDNGRHDRCLIPV